MARDNTLEERIETTLYTAGVHNSGEIASVIMDCIEEYNNERDAALFHATEVQEAVAELVFSTTRKTIQ